MPLKRNDLFGWERFSKPRVYSRSQRVNTESDVQDWIKTVEDASESAAAATFGEKHGRVKNGHMDRTTANAAISDMHIHDAAYNEAQDLLQHWVAEKLDFDTELEFTDETWNQQKTEAEIKSEWDHLLLDDDDPCFGGLESGILNSSHIKAKLEEDDIYGQLDDDNEAAVVDSILQKMLDKEVVSKAVIQDLGVGDSVKQHIDPRTKMQMRHLQVKTNREKRLKEKETKLEQLRIKKDAQFKARHLLQKEDQQKAAEAKREEMEIQREMAHIRKEMENERKKGEEDRQRLLRAQREKERVLREHMMREQAFEKDGQREAEQQAEERQRLMLKRIEEIQARETRRRLKTLQRHFSMWYRLVVDRRMKMGKARAMADWRLVLRAWTTWRTYVQNHKLDIEAQQHDVYMRELHRKQMAAQEHYKQTLEKKCFTAWQLYLTQAQQLSIIEEKQKLTKNKIANFLNAAATGKLWSGRSDGDDLRRSRSFGDINQSSDSTQKRVDEMFEQTTCKRPASARMEMPAGRSDKHFHRARTKNGVDIPSEPWQVSRKHLKLTKEQLAMLGGRRGDVTHLALPAGSEGERNTKRAWEKTPFTPSTFEHRYTAQQKALSMQQKQLKEQQRLITDLQYLQRQQLLQQQAVQQQLVQQRVDGVAMATGDAVVKATPMPLQKHLSRLQEEVLGKEGGDVSGLRGNVGSETSGGIARPESAVTSGGDNGSSRTARSVVSATGSNASSSHTVKHAQFVKAMEQRAAERARLKQDREERKRKMEDEKVMRLEAEMMEKLKEEEEEKRLKQEAYRERKRVEKLREKEHVEQVERMKQLTALAADHYQKAVVKFRGWRPWRALVTQMREKTDRAEKHYNSTVVRKCFTSWRVTVKEELEEKKALACGLHRRHLMLRCFGSWKKFGQYTAIQEERAIKFYERNLLTRILVEWAEYATEEKVAMWRKEKHAKEHNTRRMQRITFTAWLKFPRLAREQMEKEKRRQRMRQKVASMLPDFQPSAHVNKSIDLL